MAVRGALDRCRPGERWPVGLWDLDAIAARCRWLLARLGEPPETATALPDAMLVSAAVVRFLREEPLLPAALTPDGWPVDDLRRVYREYDRRLGRVLRSVIDEPSPALDHRLQPGHPVACRLPAGVDMRLVVAGHLAGDRVRAEELDPPLLEVQRAQRVGEQFVGDVGLGVDHEAVVAEPAVLGRPAQQVGQVDPPGGELLEDRDQAARRVGALEDDERRCGRDRCGAGTPSRATTTNRVWLPGWSAMSPASTSSP